MADLKITELAALTTVLGEDLLAIVDDPTGTASTKKIRVDDVLKSQVITDTYANKPAASQEGRIFLPSDGISIERDTGAAWVPWGPLFPFTAPVDGDFAWINQDTASVSATNGGIFLLAPKTAGVNLRIRKKAAPAVPYTITMAMLPLATGQSFLRMGLLFRQSADGKLHSNGIQFGTTINQLISEKWTDHHSYSAAYVSTTFNTVHNGLWFLRIADDNTNRIISFSADGQNFRTLHTVGRTDFLTADEVGFFIDTNQATIDGGMTVISWKES